MIPKERWKHSQTTIYNVSYHIIFCPKYRKKLLIDDIEIRLRQLLLEKATAMDIEIANLEIMPDHVHLFVKAKPTASPHWIVGQLKGYTSHILRKEFEILRTRIPTLWTRSYYLETIGHISEETIIKYIEDQKKI
jgi:putative transposase